MDLVCGTKRNGIVVKSVNDVHSQTTALICYLFVLFGMGFFCAWLVSSCIVVVIVGFSLACELLIPTKHIMDQIGITNTPKKYIITSNGIE